MTRDFNIDMLQVIGDFLELGHVENIVAMFKQDRNLYSLTGDLLRDERFTVRLGIGVLFEELAIIHPKEISLAIPSLLPLLQEQNPIFQVREIVADILHQGAEAPQPESPSGNDESS